MAKNKKRLISKGFIIGLFVYALVLAAIAAAGLSYFSRYMAAYEQTRPRTAIREYVDSLSEEYILAHAPDFFDGLDSYIQSREESAERVWDAVRDLDYVRQYAPDGELVYALKSGGTVFGTVTFTRGEEELMGFPVWQLSAEEFSFDYLCADAETTVPEDYTVLCGGRALGEEHISERGIPYSLLEEFYDDYALPTLVTYRTGSYIGEMELQVLSADGSPVDPDQLDEAFYTDNCTDEEKELVSDFVNKYINRYVSFLSGARGGVSNYGRLNQLVLKGSDLASRLNQALGGLGYASSRADEIESITVNEVMNVGEGRYVCSVTYLVNTLGNRGYVETTNNSKLVLFTASDGLRAASQASY